MEYTQWDKADVTAPRSYKVLILVVMEYTQWATFPCDIVSDMSES